MRKVIYISLLLLGFLSAARAQEKVIYLDTSLLQHDEPVGAPDEALKLLDDSTINKFTASTTEEEPADTNLYRNNLDLSFDSIRDWRNAKEYAYTRYLDSLLKNEKKEEFKSNSGNGFLSRLFNSDFVSVLLWTLGIFFILFIIYRLFLAEGVFRRKSKSAKNAEASVEEEILDHDSDFDALIRQTLQNANYRQAVRYQYLRTLHLLADKNRITLAPDKTNFHYVHEIANRNQQQQFATLTLNYEYVWYGEFDIDKNIYQKIENNFTGFNQKI